MRAKTVTVPVLVLLVGLLIGSDDSARAEGHRARETLTVYAAASLKESFETMRMEFIRQNPGVEIKLTFAGSQDLRAKIEQGARVDIFASADQQQMDGLLERGLVERSDVIAHNDLVIVVPKGNPANIHAVRDLQNARRLSIGDDTVPVGRYTMEMLTRASLEQGPDFQAHVLGHVVAREPNVREVLAKVASGEADAGIVYRTDAIAMPGKVEAIEIPRGFNVVATYPIAVLTTSRAQETASKFVQFVRSSAGKKVLAGKGFHIGRRMQQQPAAH